MGNFQGGGNRGGGFRGGNGGGGFRGGNGGGRSEVTMHKATCDECHKSCEVPFRPSGDKPVYCSDCFSTKRDDGDRGGDRGPRRDFGDRGPKRDFGNKPQSFAKPTAMPSNDGVAKQLSDINSKLDRLVSVMEKMTTKEVKASPVVAIKKVEVKKAPEVKAVAKKAPTKVVAKKVVTKKKK
jgi:CxxC-x17-CxxC domain-containing protein